MTLYLWMGYAQTTKNDNGNGSHSRFPGFVHTRIRIPSKGSHGELGPPHPSRMEAGAGSDHDGTRNMSRAVHLLRFILYFNLFSGIKYR
jgi:hypothetical protein